MTPWFFFVLRWDIRSLWMSSGPLRVLITRLLCNSIRCSVLVWPRLSTDCQLLPGRLELSIILADYPIIVNWTTWHGSRLAFPFAMVASVWEVLLCLPLPPFWASAAATLELQDAILAEVVLDDDEFRPLVMSRWCALFNSEPLLDNAACSQRCWDAAAIIQGKTTLMNHTSGPIDKARLFAVSAPHAGDWLMAMPLAIGYANWPCQFQMQIGHANFILWPETRQRDGSVWLWVCGWAAGCALSIAVPVAQSLTNEESTDCLVGWRRAGWPVTEHSTTSYTVLLALQGFRRSWSRGDWQDLMTGAWSEGCCLAWDATVADSLAESHINK